MTASTTETLESAAVPILESLRSTCMRAASIALVLCSCALPAHAQSAIPEASTLVRASAAPVELPAGGTARARITLTVEPGWHINANPPSLDYMIPTVVTLTAAGGVAPARAIYPKGHEQKLAFEETPLLVYDGATTIEVPLRWTNAAAGEVVLEGSVRFQACNDQVCLPPATVPLKVAVRATGIAPAGVTGAMDSVVSGVDTTGSPDVSASGGASSARGSGFTSAPPPGGATSGGAIAGTIGGWFDRNPLIAYLLLFGIGLALNLTPCVYPMIGVTVSIFGARRAAPTGQVLLLATIYVLGIAVTYTTLGVVAALTGGLFGGVLQSPPVLVGIGVLFMVLALSMFGLYELQLPPALLSKLGGTGTTGAAGVFGSGLVVGLFAAPCIGPPVVALLTLVGAKGDPWFGLTTFFVLSLGLGAPYLFLATFSNLLQQLPRSGAWMVWVKKLFGVILVAVGAFYVCLAFAPKLAAWIPPLTLLIGGFYLGFLDRSATAPGFRRLRWGFGTLAVLAGAALVATTPREGIAFREFEPAALSLGLESGRPALLDFTADWCVPCHELERVTFSDRRVVDRARDFDTYRVDLTRFDSPEAERWREQFGITGVPTVVFLTPQGVEVPAARVEGFLPPEPFLQRMRVAAEASAIARR